MARPDRTHHEVWVENESGFIGRHTFDTPTQAEEAAEEFQKNPKVIGTEIYSITITPGTKWRRAPDA